MSDSHIGPIPWDLNRKGSNDQKRHLDKLKDAIKKQLPTVIASTPLINSTDKDVVSVPVSILDIPKFIMDNSEEDDGDDGIGNGSERVSPGDITAKKRVSKKQGYGDEAGDEAGEHIVEVDVPVDYLIDLVFDELSLPKMRKLHRGVITENETHWNTRRKHGPLSVLDLRATVKEAILRKAKGGEEDFIEDDFRFKSWTNKIKPVSDASVYLLRDVSGSMGEEKKYMSRSIAYWLVKWLRRQYQSVHLEFWIHDVTAREVETEEEFFGISEGGGTVVASGVEAIDNKIVLNTAVRGVSNNYVFMFSDGDDMDTSVTKKAVESLCGKVNLVGYVELRGGRLMESGLWRSLNGVSNDNLKKVAVNSFPDVGRALRGVLADE